GCPAEILVAAKPYPARRRRNAAPCFARAYSPSVLLRCRDAVNLPRSIIRDKQCPIRSDCYSHRPARHVAPLWIRHKTRQERHRISRGLPILERDKRNLIPRPCRPVPRTMLRDKRATPIAFRKLLSRVKRKLQRSHVRA